MLWNGQITLAFLVKYGKINNIKFNKNCGRAKALYIPARMYHVHGHLEPVSRKVRATFTETEPITFDNYQSKLC